MPSRGRGPGRGRGLSPPRPAAGGAQARAGAALPPERPVPVTFRDDGRRHDCRCGHASHPTPATAAQRAPAPPLRSAPARAGRAALAEGPEPPRTVPADGGADLRRPPGLGGSGEKQTGGASLAGRQHPATAGKAVAEILGFESLEDVLRPAESAGERHFPLCRVSPVPVPEPCRRSVGGARPLGPSRPHRASVFPCGSAQPAASRGSATLLLAGREPATRRSGPRPHGRAFRGRWSRRRLAACPSSPNNLFPGWQPQTLPVRVLP